MEHRTGRQQPVRRHRKVPLQWMRSRMTVARQMTGGGRSIGAQGAGTLRYRAVAAISSAGHVDRGERTRLVTLWQRLGLTRMATIIESE